MLDKAGECRGQGRENSTAFCSGWGINRPTGAPGLQSSIQMQLRPQSPQRKDSGHLDRGWIPGQIPVGEAMWLPFSQAGSTRATGLAAAGPPSPPPPNPVPQPGRGQGTGLRDPEHPPTPTGCLSPALPAALTGPRPRDKVGRDVRGCWLDGFSPHTPGLQVRLTSLRARRVEQVGRRTPSRRRRTRPCPARAHSGPMTRLKRPCPWFFFF